MDLARAPSTFPKTLFDSSFFHAEFIPDASHCVVVEEAAFQHNIDRVITQDFTVVYGRHGAQVVNRKHAGVEKACKTFKHPPFRCFLIFNV